VRTLGVEGEECTNRARYKPSPLPSIQRAKRSRIMAGTQPLSFASIAQKKEKNGTLQHVRLDARAVLQIAKHCRETMPDLVSGQLLGLDVQDTLEVTYCFPFPVSCVLWIYLLLRVLRRRVGGLCNQSNPMEVKQRTPLWDWTRQLDASPMCTFLISLRP